MLMLAKILAMVFIFGCLNTPISDTFAKELSTEKVFTVGEDGKLTYIPDANGNVIPDFSYSGYKKSEEPIPYIGTTISLQPIAGDNTQHIQKAIDALSRLPLQENGFRGALLLDRGFYSVSGQLVIEKSGIVLRGVGQGENDTVVFAAGTDRRSLIHVKGNLHLDKHRDVMQKLIGPYIPVGTRSVKVADASAFSVGQDIIIFRPGTKQWIQDLGMDKLPARKDDRPIRQWAPEEYNFNYERKITKIKKNEIFFDIPIVQMMEDRYGGGFVYPVAASGRLENIGIENMRLVSHYKSGQLNSDEEHSWVAIEISDTENAWVSDVSSYHFAYSLVSVKRGSRFITIKDSTSIDPASLIKGGRRYSFNLAGSQALFLRCYARNGRHDFVTSSRVAGPSAFVYSEAENTHSDIGPHHRWATGILYDNVKGGEINIQDRGNRGSGHGWAGAQQVLWNTQASGRTSVQSPPAAINWSIGHVGRRWQGLYPRNQGVWLSEGRHVKPESLFVQQLSERIGAEQAGKVLAKQQYRNDR